MRKSCNKYLLFLAIGALFVGGCAKHEMVKTDEMVPETRTAKSAETSVFNPWPSDNAVKEQPINEQPINEQPLKEQAIKELPIKALPGGDIAKTTNVEARPGDLEKIFFDFDSYTLTTIARDTLAKNSEVMKKKAGVKIRIEGHCDERGSDEYNLALGEKRAKSAMQYLQTMGVPAERLAVISYGKEKPADLGHGETAWAKNRRDEFLLLSK
jgi:peptidoglycan-associated lipoprotein